MRCLNRIALSILMLLYLTVAAWPGVTLASDDLRVGCYELPGFVSQANNGAYEGYGVDFLEMLSRYTGWKFQIVVASHRDLKQMLQNGELDLLMPVEYTRENLQAYAFTTYPLGEQITGLYTLKQNYNLFYDDFKNFQNLRIGSVQATYPAQAMADYARDHHFSYREMLYPNQEALHQAMENGQIDAVCRSALGNIPLDYRLIGIAAINPFYLAAPASKADGPLKNIDAAIRLLNYERPAFMGDLHAKYFQGTKGTAITSMTREELEYLKTKRTISVALFGDRYPVAYKGFKTGLPDGILKDLLDQVSLKTGLTFVYHLVPEGTNLLTYLRNGEADLVAGVVDTEALQKNYAIVLSEGLMPTMTGIAGMRGLVFDPGYPYRVAVPANDEGTIGHLQRMHPHFKLQTYISPAAAMRAVKDGQADVTMQNAVILSALLQHDEFSNLSLWYTANEEGTYSYCVAERSTFDPRLISIIDKGIHSLNKADVQNIILRQEASIDEGTTFRDYLARYRVALPLTLLLILAVAGGIFYNITTRQRHMAVLEQQNAELARANALTRKAMEASRQANAAKTDFLSRMSHDIRTPLNGVIGMTALAREKNQDREVQGFLEKIDISSHYLLSLVNDLLDLTKINAGKMELHPEPYTQEEFLQYLSSVIVPMCKSKQIALTTQNPPIDYALLVDKLKYNQILFNLLSNAVKFTPVGGKVCLSFIPCSLVENRLDFVMQVTDNGAGMSAAFQKKLFEPFEQELPAGTSNEKGTGLGLAITWKLVELMDGTITVDSAVGRGTTFKVRLTLPVIPQQQVQQAPVQEVTPHSLQGRTILIAEDNAINAEILSRILKKYDAQVVLAENGAVAVQKFKTVPHLDAILMDVRMPVLDGKEATRQIRSLQLYGAQTIPIIATTANAYDEDVESCLQAGMNAHVAKPINPLELLRLLDKLLHS